MTFYDLLTQPKSMKRWASWWAMLITVPWILAIFVSIASSRHSEQVSHREQQAVGIITSHEANNHNQYRYTFTVAGRTFSGLSQSSSEETAIGDHQIVFFDPRDPGTNSLQDFGNRQSVAGLVALAGMGTMGVACVILFSKRKQKSSQHTN